MLKELPEDAPMWVTDLVQDLETQAATHDGCEHSRSAYRDAARQVLDYWEDAQEDS